MMKQVAVSYREAPMERKGVILNDLCALTGWNHAYARRACARLRPARSSAEVTRGWVGLKRSSAVHKEAVIDALRVVRVLMDFPSSEGLQPVLADVVDALRCHGSSPWSRRSTRSQCRCRQPRSTGAWSVTTGGQPERSSEQSRWLALSRCHERSVRRPLCRAPRRIRTHGRPSPTAPSARST